MRGPGPEQVRIRCVIAGHPVRAREASEKGRVRGIHMPLVEDRGRRNKGLD